MDNAATETDNQSILYPNLTPEQMEKWDLILTCSSDTVQFALDDTISISVPDDEFNRLSSHEQKLVVEYIDQLDEMERIAARLASKLDLYTIWQSNGCIAWVKQQQKKQKHVSTL